MESIVKYIGKTLTLLQPKFFKNELALMDGEEKVGSLVISHKLLTSAVLEINNKKWEIRQLSFWKSELGVFQPGYELPLAAIKRKLFGDGIVELPKGYILNIHFRFWKGMFELADQYGDILLFSKGRGGIKEKYFITINKSPHVLDEYPWLVLLPGFLAAISKSHSAVT
jgi:hypothetical protein